MTVGLLLLLGGVLILTAAGILLILFCRLRVGGATHLVVATADPAEVVFFVRDVAAWERALDSGSPR